MLDLCIIYCFAKKPLFPQKTISADECVNASLSLGELWRPFPICTASLLPIVILYEPLENTYECSVAMLVSQKLLWGVHQCICICI